MLNAVSHFMDLPHHDFAPLFHDASRVRPKISFRSHSPLFSALFHIWSHSQQSPLAAKINFGSAVGGYHAS